MVVNSQHTTITPTSSNYPIDVQKVLPDTTLTCVGKLELLGMKAIGICGSRNASEDALKWAYKFGAAAAEAGLVVVSGYARGIDRESHKGAMESGGNTIAVLSEGIGNFRIIRDLKPMLRLTNNFLAVSMFEPNAVWKSWRAMERNKLIVGLSAGLFVVEARETGGTINAALECSRQNKPLWAVAYSEALPEREGNRILLQKSAIPLNRLSDVKKALDQATAGTESEVEQLALDLV